MKKLFNARMFALVKSGMITCMALMMTLICHSQNINPAIQLKDGNVVDNSHAFLDGETPTFSLQNGTSANVQWVLCLVGNKGEKLPAAESSTSESSFSFTITPDLFPRKSFLKHMEFPNDSNVYICASIELYKDGTLIDEMPLLLNVLPSRPKVTEGSLVGAFDYEAWGYYPLSHLTLSFTSNRMENCIFVYFTVGWDGVKYVPDWAVVRERMNVQRKSNNNYQLEYDGLDCDNFFSIIAGNKYGSVNGDTICTNDYITDSDVLDFLVDAIDDISGDECEIVIHNNLISVEGCNSNDIVMEIYSSDGKLVRKNIAEKKIDINCLPNAAYIVKINYKNKLLTKKIIKL
ncbi:MAG: T9SS type A sorting domain-containing protein [Bacteroidaceae bacterium]|nr:T9SS type A sorting domain-containing protein [Bacteroidaceae bacterium]